MNVASLVVSIFAALGAIGAFVVAWTAQSKTTETSKVQINLQTRLATIEEQRRSEEVESERLLPASAVHAWDTSTGTEAVIHVHNMSAEPVHDVVCWAWPLLVDPPELSADQTAADWPNFPDFPTTQYLWIGSLGPGEKKSVQYCPTSTELQCEPRGTLFEIEFTDGMRRDWNRSHDGTLKENFRRPYSC